VNERTRDLAQSINELKVLEEVGRAVASCSISTRCCPRSPLGRWKSPMPTLLIYGYDAGNHQFSLTESIGIDKSAEGRHCAIDADHPRWRAPRASRSPFCAGETPEHRLRDVALEAGFNLCRRSRWSTRPAFWARWWCCGAGEFPPI
jgi:hypothetical protein